MLTKAVPGVEPKVDRVRGVTLSNCQPEMTAPGEPPGALHAEPAATYVPGGEAIRTALHAPPVPGERGAVKGTQDEQGSTDAIGQG